MSESSYYICPKCNCGFDAHPGDSCPACKAPTEAPAPLADTKGKK